MVHTEINQYIRELLYQYDCVIIPGFGGLVAQPQPATVNAISRQILPPSKKIGFNQHLLHNDGLLANHISRVASCSYAEAVAFLHSFTEKARFLLQNHHGLTIEGVGSFRMGQDQTLIFTADKTDTFLYESYGLKAVAASPATPARQEIKPQVVVQEETILPAPAPVLMKEEEKTETPEETEVAAETAIPVMTVVKRPHKKLGIGFVAASAAVVCISLFTIYLASNNIHLPFLHGGNNQTSSFANTTFVATPNVQEADNTEPQAEAPAAETDKETTGTAEKPVTAPAEKTSVAPEVTPPTEQVTENTDGTTAYYVIAGAFMNEENANSMLQKLKSQGYNQAALAGRTRGNKLLRVAYLRTSSLSEAEQQLSSIRAGNQTEAWILKLP